MDGPEIIVPALLFSIPILGILGWTLVTIVRTIFGVTGTLSKKEIKQLVDEIRQLRQQNVDSQQRIENLETIVTSIDSELLEGFLKLQSINNPNIAKQKIERMVGNTSQGQLPPASQSIDDNLKSIVNKILARVDGFLDENKKNNNDKYKSF